MSIDDRRANADLNNDNDIVYEPLKVETIKLLTYIPKEIEKGGHEI